MSEDTFFRILAAAVVIVMIGTSIFYRHRADREGGRVSRQEEPAFVRLGLSVSGLMGFGGLLAYFVYPSVLEPTMVQVPTAVRWLGLALGILVVVLNDAMLVFRGVTLLPLGHSELWLLVGLAVAAIAVWLLGVFDRGTTVYR